MLVAQHVYDVLSYAVAQHVYDVLGCGLPTQPPVWYLQIPVVK